jgi:hypothetical protein
VLAKLLCVADPDDFGRRPRVEARQLGQQAKFEAEPFEVVWHRGARKGSSPKTPTSFHSG